jgi:peptidoglycan/xylan/chitin deacetylase (PgdA/CDA1 family)
MKISSQTVPGLLVAGVTLVCGLGWPGSPAAAEKEVSPAEVIAPLPNLAFGSSAVLESCWTKEQLAGAPGDKKISALRAGAEPAPPALACGQEPRPLPAELRNSIRSVKPRDQEKVIALTFDLCEREGEKAGYDFAIVNYLRQHRIPATFYPSGHWMRLHPERTLQLMSDPLFEVGNHSWSHPDLRLLAGATLEDQVLWAQAQYQELRSELIRRPCAAKAGPEELAKIPESPATFRFPYGACNTEGLRFLAEQGLPAIQWSIVTADAAKTRTAEDIAKLVLRRARPGAIIVGHANGLGRATAEALPLFIPALLKRGYRLVTVSELLTFGPAVTAPDCYEQKPGDNLNYDRLFDKGRP